MVGLVDSDPYRKASEQIVGLAAAERQPDLSNARVPSSGNFDPQAALPRASQAPAEPEQRGIIEEGYDAFLYSLGPQNIQLFGAGLRSLGATMQQEDMYNAGFEIEKYGEELDFGEAPSMPKIEDAESLARWMAGGLGQGLGSVGAPLASGAVGGLAGAMVGGAPGAVVGAIGAGFAVNDIILAGEAYKQFEDSGVDPLQAAEVAQMIAPAMAALDTLGLVKVLKGPGRKASDGILKFMAKRMAHGASVEAATEMAQGVIREITDANLSGDIKATERAMAILEEGVIAGMTGGVLGGAGSIASRRPTDDGPPPTTDDPIETPEAVQDEEEALPEVEEEALPDVEELPETEVVEDLEPEPVPPQTQEDVEAEIDEALAPVEPEPEAAIEDQAEVQEEVDQAPTPEPEPAPDVVPSTTETEGGGDGGPTQAVPPTEAEDTTPFSAEVDEDPEYTAALQEGLPIEEYRRTGPAPEVIRGFKDATGERDAGNVLVGQIDDSNWYTNGRLIVKGDLPEGFSEGNGETATPSYVGKNLKPIVDMPSTTERMEVVGAQQITNQDGQAHNMLWLTDNNENFAAVDQESVQFVEREYGEVDWTLAKGDRQGVVKATKDGEVVAVALPFTGDTPTNIIDIAKAPPQEQQVDPAEQVESVRFKRGDPIKAWHGSGAVFDKFDVQYMGTGEGKQVFGWGMYAAENKQVGQAYRERATEAAPTGEVRPGDQGALYELGINVEPSEMLYWDDKLSNMDKGSQEKIKAALNDEAFSQGVPNTDKLFSQKTGEIIYRMMVRRLGSDQAASQHLMKHGIKANKYFDGMSRSQRDGTYNYVVFDPDLMEIAARYKRPPPRSPGYQSNPTMSVDEVQGIVDKMARKWDAAKLPAIKVIKSLDELPDNVKKIISAEVGDLTFTEEAMLITKGDGTSEVYVISDNASSAEGVRKAIAHEVVGHFSVSEMLGSEFPKILKQIQNTRNSAKVKPFWDMVDKLYPDMSEDVKAEEVIALMAETRAENPIMTRVIAAIRRFLRSLGLNLSYSYNDIRSMISKAEKRLDKEADPRMQILAEDSNPVNVRVPDAVRMSYSATERSKAARTPQPQMRATHSMSVSNLLSALDRGTLIAPSIAVTPADQPHRWGGPGTADITFKADVVDPSSFTITQGDAYTPMVPSTFNTFKGTNEQRNQTRDNFAQDIEELPPSRKKKLPQGFHPSGIIDYRGRFETDWSMMGALEQVYQHQTRKRGRINSPEGEAWLAEYLERISPYGTVQESFFGGFTYTGQHKHTEATPENILKDMRRQQREDGMDFGGHGKVWAKWRPKLTNKKKMRDAAARVERDVEKYEKIKEEMTAELLNISDQITDLVHVGERRSVFAFETGLDILLEAGPHRARLERVMRGYKDDARLSDYLFDEITEHFRKVGEMPLQFLEAKALKQISMRDVAGVVLPKGTSSEVAKRLKERGIKVNVKNENTTDAELAKMQSSAPNVRFKRKVTEEPTDKPAGKNEFKIIDPSKPLDTIFRLLVGGSLTIGPDGNMKYTKAMQDATRKLIMEMRPNVDNNFAMPYLDAWIENARHAWLNRYGTPKDFIVRDRQRSAHAYQIMNELITFLEKIRDAQMNDSQYEALQDILEGKQLNDAKLNQLAPEIRESIDKYGKQLVDLGLLNEETYLENLGTYMHRSYRTYEFDAPDMVKWGRNIRKKSRQALRGDELKMRGMTHKFDEKQLLRDIPEKLKEKAKGVKEWRIVDGIGETGRVGKRHYIPVGMENEVPAPKPPEGGELVERGTWKIREGKGYKPVLWRDYTKEERKRNQEIRDARYNLIKTYELFAHDISTGKFFQDIANNEAWFSKKEPDSELVITGDQAAKSFSLLAEAEWVKVPEGTIAKSNAKRWGALAGGYVRAPIWRDINELEKMQNPGTWGWLLREWKANKTARSPTVHFNNFVGNWILSELYDFRQRDIIRAIKEFRARGPVYEEAIQHGVFDSGYVRSELLGGAESKKVIDEVLKEVSKAENIEPGALGKAWAKMTRPVKGTARAMEQAYQFEDELFRLLSFMNDRAMGLSPEAAAENAINRFMNYDIRAPLPNALRRTIFPFLSYSYAFVPVWLKSMAAKPWKIAKIATIGYAISMMSHYLIEGDEEDERRVMSERDLGYTWAGLPKTLRTPFTSQGDPIYIGLQRVLPGGGLTDMDAGHVSGLPEWLLVSGPMLLAAELFLNRMSFNGQEIYNQVDTKMETSKKIGTYLWRGAMPNFPMLPYSYSTDMLVRSFTGETDLFGRNYSPVIAGIRQLGPKLYPFDYDTQLAYRMMDIDRDVRAYKKKLWQAAMDKKNNSISESTYNKTLAQVQEGMARLAEKAQEVTGN